MTKDTNRLWRPIVVLESFGGMVLLIMMIFSVSFAISRDFWVFGFCIVILYVAGLTSFALMLWQTRDEPMKRTAGRVFKGLVVLLGVLFIALSCLGLIAAVVSQI